MATRITRRTISDYTPDFEGRPFRVAYSYEAGCHVVIEVATGKAEEVEGAQAAYELAASRNYDAAAEPSDDDSLVCYCEACGHEVDPAVAVLDGEQMVCPSCAPCTAAPETFASDPETWQAVSEIPCEVADFRPITTYLHDMVGAAVTQIGPACYRAVWMGYYVGDPFSTYAAAECEAVAAWAKANPGYTPAPAGAASAIARAEIFDSLCDAADLARDYYRDVPTRMKVYNDAWEWLIEQETLYFNAAGDLLYPSESEPGKVHAVGVSCSCTAGRWGSHCRHAAAADIIGRARRLARLQNAA